VPTVSETIDLDGVRCERCVMRLAKVLEGHDGLESASATLMGQVSVVYDDERTSRDALLGAIARGGFRERISASA
jgi:copper chaperone CopZ